MGVEVPVDPDLVPVEGDRGDRLPQVISRWVIVFAAAEEEHVGDRLGARGGLVGAGGQAHRPDEVSQQAHFPAGAGVLGVEGVLRGQYGHEPAGAGRAQGLEDEVVVDRLSGGVVDRVVENDFAERDVADDGIELTVCQAGLGERLGTDVRVRVEVAADGGGDRVQFHPRHARLWWGQADERPGPGAGFEDLTAGEAQRGHRPPEFSGDEWGRVVGVECRAGGILPFLLREQAAQFLPLVGPLVVAGIEDLGQSTPAGPPGQHGLFLLGSQALLFVEGPGQCQGVEVGAEAGPGTGGHARTGARIEPRSGGG
ncbi:hypothetical protein [Brevibacterium picturae]|uniref:hypothetical protein n=1 Tax=Brevibacterium picturae TaxID=260553 RepID=UPI0031F86A03